MNITNTLDGQQPTSARGDTDVLGLARHPAAEPPSVLLLLALAFGLLTGCAGLTEPTRTDRPVDDRVITARVQKAIADEVGAESVAAIDVDTRDGVVRLGGVVASAAHRTRAAAAAASARGVRQVENAITVQ